jgi:hypothetical protein
VDQLEELVQREKAKIVAETAKAPWNELEVLYAQGKLILVCNSLDLVEVAYQLSIDNAEKTKQWINQGKLLRDFSEQAKIFSADNSDLWCVVIKPWVLVQSVNTGAS